MATHYNGLVFTNEILVALPPEEIRILRPLLTRVQLVRGQIIYESGDTIEHAYFVESGMLSVGAKSEQPGADVMVDTIGKEGVAGLSALLNEDAVAFHRIGVQWPGAARRIPTEAFQSRIGALPTLKSHLLSALDLSLTRTMQNVVCQSRHTLLARLARWLTTMHDIGSSDTLSLTQEFLSGILGARRSRLAHAIDDLEAAGAILHTRGHVVVTDRRRLEVAACDCYKRLQSYARNRVSQDIDLSLGMPAFASASVSFNEMRRCDGV